MAHFSHSSPTLFPCTGLLSLSHGPAPALAQTARASTAPVHAAQPQRQPRSLTPRPSPAPRARLLSLSPGPARQISPLPPSAISARALCFASARSPRLCTVDHPAPQPACHTAPAQRLLEAPHQGRDQAEIRLPRAATVAAISALRQPGTHAETSGPPFFNSTPHPLRVPPTPHPQP